MKTVLTNMGFFQKKIVDKITITQVNNEEISQYNLKHLPPCDLWYWANHKLAFPVDRDTLLW